jgi:hypothetical protein
MAYSTTITILMSTQNFTLIADDLNINSFKILQNTI